MINDYRRLLRGAALSGSLLFTAVPAAMAEPADQGLNPATVEYTAYTASVNRDTHPTQVITNDEIPGCSAQCAYDARATIWNLNNVGAR